MVTLQYVGIVHPVQSDAVTVNLLLETKRPRQDAKEDFNVFKNMIEDELESIEEKLSKEGVKLSNIIKRISNDYSSLEQRDQEIVQNAVHFMPF